MLVLSRRAGEQIVVGDHLSIVVLEIHRSYVRLGLEAPAEQPIRRGELKLHVGNLSGRGQEAGPPRARSPGGRQQHAVDPLADNHDTVS